MNDSEFDIRPLSPAALDDLDNDLFARVYLPSSIADDVLEQNHRSIAQQYASLRFTSVEPQSIPTTLGILIVGREPRRFISGDYIQFLRIDGTEWTDPIKYEKEIDGTFPDLIKNLDETFQVNIAVAIDITSQPVEIRQPDYPLVALQQLARNAIMHRTYEWTNAPVRITWFSDRIEIQNPGGLFGRVNQENFGSRGITDYRNPHLAEAMKKLRYSKKLGIGIALACQALERNGNPPPEFIIIENHFLVIVKSYAKTI